MRQLAYASSIVAALALGACVAPSDTTTASKSTAPGAVAGSTAVTSYGATDTKVKRPKPENLRFVSGFDNYSIFSETVGRIWLRDVDQKTFVEYKPIQRPNPTDTRLVVACSASKEKVSFPINNEFYGPAPVCGKGGDLIVGAE